MNEISSVGSVKMVSEEISGAKAKNASTEASFGQFLSEAIDNADRLQKEKESAIIQFTAGEEPDIHKTMMAIRKADTSFKLMTAVINRARKAYEEIHNMQI